MPITITMPALSPTMTEGTLAKWLVNEGDTISSGDIIAEIETDKATMEVETVDEGKVARILVPEGTEGVAVNAAIAIVLEEDEDESALSGYQPAGGPAPAAAAEAPPPAAAPAAETPAPAPAAAAPKANGGGAVQAAPPAPTNAAGERVKASPLARRMAAQAGLDLAAMTGSGPHGRIVKADIEKALSLPAPAAAPTAAPVPAPAAPTGEPQPFEPEFEFVAANNMRKVVARRMTESKQQVPHFYMTVDCEIDALLALRKDLNARGEGDFKLSVNDLVIKASALALMKVPAANASWTGDGIKYYKSADIAVAVALDGGLITPIVRAAERKGLSTISAEMKELAARAREGKLRPEEFQGGSFSISNLGMYGIKHFEAVINMPHGCILAIGAGEQRPVVKDGTLAVATVMSCTLSVDHRSVDGAVGAEYLAAFKKLIEDPMTMML